MDNFIDAKRVAQFDELVAPYGCPWKLKDILSEVLDAGACAGLAAEQ